MSALPWNQNKNILRRIDRLLAKESTVTCPASRHLRMIGEALAKGRPYPMLSDEPGHCAETMLICVEMIWKLRRRGDAITPET